MKYNKLQAHGEFGDLVVIGQESKRDMDKANPFIAGATYRVLQVPPNAGPIANFVKGAELRYQKYDPPGKEFFYRQWFSVLGSGAMVCWVVDELEDLKDWQLYLEFLGR